MTWDRIHSLTSTKRKKKSKTYSIHFLWGFWGHRRDLHHNIKWIHQVEFIHFLLMSPPHTLPTIGDYFSLVSSSLPALSQAIILASLSSFGFLFFFLLHHLKSNFMSPFLLFSRGSSWPRDRTQVSHIAGRCFNLWAIWEAQLSLISLNKHLLSSYYMLGGWGYGMKS